ncbi:VOC family protein [Vibrio fortis]|jgi:predicted enzyme related to lactoylglutathione lyase|uniref:Glyoxalase n=1 Tax=Vibrio fortis TaxID=212667 RepID=A0A066US15_9VIBR|nr:MULTISPECIES: VOC family protein [Vibrio]KDN26944.1 glyoxalase [Vibrio fortis]MDK9760563.1 VOC family protein [Vibrio sp. D420a]QFT12417.1 Glyoxalase-like domain protein [Vibrio sp. THAF190c]|tara:strand:+ start:1092 stop:1442 length:351 start_codon:yes stop_codon:yes gene_type:complete
MEHGSINYIEFAAKDLDKTKAFFESVFQWQFEDYGPEYTAFTAKGLMGGFYQSELACDASAGGALMVFYSQGLEQTEQEIVEAGGMIKRDIFAFPGGRRFHFCEPSGNEMAVWSDK